MNRRVFLLSSAGSLLLASAGAAAVSHEQDVARALVQQGYRITSQRRTWLGRVRFTAAKGRVTREVVVDPSSGEILRDYSREDEAVQSVIRAGNRGSGTGSSSGSEGTSGNGGESDGESPGGESSSGDGESSSGGETESPDGETESPEGETESLDGERSDEPARERDGVRK